MTSDLDLHNEIAARAVSTILCPSVIDKPDPTLALVILESVIVGVLSVTCKPGMEDAMFDALLDGIRERLPEARNKNGRQDR